MWSIFAQKIIVTEWEDMAVDDREEEVDAREKPLEDAAFESDSSFM